MTGGSDGIGGAEKPGFFGFDLSNSFVMYFMALVFFVLVYWACAGCSTRRSATFSSAFARTSRACGRWAIRRRAYKLLSFTIAGAIGGLSGGLYAIFNGFISPRALYWTTSGDILIMVMLGGAGTLIGPAIGAGVFLLMKNIVSSYSEHWLLSSASSSSVA